MRPWNDGALDRRDPQLDLREIARLLERQGGQRADGPLAPDNDVIASLRGDLHVHSDWSDGASSIVEMAVEASRLGRRYIAMTDHSPRLRVARGLDRARRLAQLEQIADLNAVLTGVTVLAGAEVDILEDGSLDHDPDTLGRLAIVVASVHSKLAMPPDAMTARLVGAIAHPRTDILGHVTGRLIAGERGTRPPSMFDAEVVFEACRRFGVAVEINSRPERCDPPDDLLALARDSGCLFSIDTDAHAPGQLGFSEYGAARAAAAGIPPERILTCWELPRLQAW